MTHCKISWCQTRVSPSGRRVLLPYLNTILLETGRKIAFVSIGVILRVILKKKRCQRIYVYRINCVSPGVNQPNIEQLDCKLCVVN